MSMQFYIVDNAPIFVIAVCHRVPNTIQLTFDVEVIGHRVEMPLLR